jgi:hypothetical protein
MDDENLQPAGERLQQPVELEQLPAVPTAASALSECLLRHLHELNPEAQAVVEQDAAAARHWRLEIICRAPAEWTLHWKLGGCKDRQRISGRERLDS